MLSRRNPQLNAHGELIHLLSIEGLPRAVVTQILDTASTFLSVNDRDVKKVPLLRGKSVFNLFFENSTRTRTTFEIAAKRLSCRRHQPGHQQEQHQPRAKACWTPSPTCRAMHADMFVVRHSESGAPYLIAQHCAPHVHVVNAGDGRHAHPTQGLLDMYTIRHFKKRLHAALSVAIVGDIVHSRVARSDIHGAERSWACPRSAPSVPRTLVPGDLAGDGRARVPRHGRRHPRRRRDHHAAPAERTHERRDAAQRRPSSSSSYGLTPEKLALAKPDCHRDAPGPDQPRRGNRVVGGRRFGTA